VSVIEYCSKTRELLPFVRLFDNKKGFFANPGYSQAWPGLSSAIRGMTAACAGLKVAAVRSNAKERIP
jgi:hypothetical protein